MSGTFADRLRHDRIEAMGLIERKAVKDAGEFYNRRVKSTCEQEAGMGCVCCTVLLPREADANARTAFVAEVSRLAGLDGLTVRLGNDTYVSSSTGAYICLHWDAQ